MKGKGMNTKTERFAIRNAEGKYLKVRRATYGSGRKRTWVDDLKKATIWNRLADVSNAWLCAYELKQVKNKPVDIVRLDIAVVGVARRVKVARRSRYSWTDATGKKHNRFAPTVVDA